MSSFEQYGRGSAPIDTVVKRYSLPQDGRDEPTGSQRSMPFGLGFGAECYRRKRTRWFQRKLAEEGLWPGGPTAKPPSAQQVARSSSLPLALSRLLTRSIWCRYGVDLDQLEVRRRLGDAGSVATQNWEDELTIEALKSVWEASDRSTRSFVEKGAGAAESREVVFDHFAVGFEDACEILEKPMLGFSLLVLETMADGAVRCRTGDMVTADGGHLQCFDGQWGYPSLCCVRRELFEEQKAWCLAIRARFTSVLANGVPQCGSEGLSTSRRFQRHSMAYDEECEREKKTTWLRRKLSEEQGNAQMMAMRYQRLPDLEAVSEAALRAAMAQLLGDADPSIRGAAARALRDAEEHTIAQDPSARTRIRVSGIESVTKACSSAATVCASTSVLSARVVSAPPLVLGTEAEECHGFSGDVTEKKPELMASKDTRQIFRMGRILVPIGSGIPAVPACASVVIENDGTVPWPDTVAVTHLRGDSMGIQSMQLGSIEPGGACEAYMALSVPPSTEPNTAYSTWAVLDEASGVSLGPVLLFEVEWTDQLTA